MCVENGICYEPVCTGRIDGTYADTTHNCIRSFTCKGGMLKEVNSCLSGETHDGYSCVSSEFHNCEKPEKTAAAFYFRADDECKSLHDGSHIVPGTDCRNVRICLRGKTTTAFECLRDERYDGNRCVPKGVVPCDDVCSMKADGYYADEFTDCESYYFCLNGKVFKRKQCSKGTAFNGYICVPSHLVSCPKKSRLFAKKCLGLQDGFHPDYLSNCRDYFYCYNHNMVLTGSCSEGFVYNGKQCVSNTASILCDGPKELQACASLPPGLHQNKTSGCTKYFYCSNGRGTELSCPSNQIFNGYKCVSTDEYTCLNPDSCDDQPDGYKQDKNTACRSYYYCSNGNKITYVCPGELIFNGSHCVSPESYECPFIPSADCIEKQDGYHPDRSSNCKDYYYCLKGEKLNTLTCGGKKIFNGRGCVLTEDPRSACLSFLSNPCRLKEDGTYADVKTDCRKYFICKNKLIVNEGWCPKGSGFNGRICKKNYTCSQTERSDCEGQPIGFYQDLSSNCKSYYFCFYNTKTVGICPDGTIFNGQLCIDSNYYTCPSGVTR